MKKVVLLLSFLLSLFYPVSVLAQATESKMSVTDRMAKARAAKSEKKDAEATTKSDMNAAGPGDRGRGTMYRSEKANYSTPVEKKPKGPNGEVVHTGERGAKYYINKNGQRTYLSSNQ